MTKINHTINKESFFYKGNANKAPIIRIIERIRTSKMFQAQLKFNELMRGNQK